MEAKIMYLGNNRKKTVKSQPDFLQAADWPLLFSDFL